MRVCGIRGRAESAITPQRHLPQRGFGRRRGRRAVRERRIWRQPIALEGAIDEIHGRGFVLGHTGTVHGAESTGDEAANEHRCDCGFEIEEKYSAHLSLSTGTSAVSAAREGRRGLRTR